LRAAAAKIGKEHPEVASVRLYGSMARGDHVGTSDADILIVLRAGALGDPLARIREFCADFRLPVPVDLLVYSEAQVARRIQSSDPQFDRLWKESLDLLSE
jgi:predicted nucleotidyltransferase